MKKRQGNKPHIGIFGRRNTGKSSFINCLVEQEIAIVSDKAGTTTDPVKKSMEIFGIGPAVLIDTAGIDDTGELGRKRIRRSMEVVKIVDCGVLIIAGNSFGDYERKLISAFKHWDVPYFIIHNRSDEQKLIKELEKKLFLSTGKHALEFSSVLPENRNEIIEELRKTIPDTVFTAPALIGDLLNSGDYVLLITPIDNEAPDGRMILPQVQVIRDVLDNNCINIVLKEDKVEEFFRSSGIKPALAITDSQVFGKMKEVVPADIPFTSFSIAFARNRGNFEHYLEGTPFIDELKDGDRLLILESCTHQVNCDDIGRHKLPQWIQEYTGRSLVFDVVAGLNSIPDAITDYAMVVQCGGCMVTRKQLSNRMISALDGNVPITNYGMAIAWMNGIFERVTRPFTESHA